MSIALYLDSKDDLDTMIKSTREAMAQRVAQDIPEGAYVNLGIGLPTLVADYIDPNREVILHSENGILGRWIQAAGQNQDFELVNAGKEHIELLDGGAFFDHAESFGMICGNHIDICVLGAFQVAENGDLANWHTGEESAVPSVGGAMDLAAGARQVFVIMNHLGRDNSKKLLKRCTYPLTGLGCVTRIYTDMAVIDVREGGLVVKELMGDVTQAQLIEATDASLTFDIPN